MLKGIYKFGFLILLMTGTMLVLNAETWFYAWMGLELNMLAFVPLIIRGTNTLNAEAGLKYFLVQAVASLMLLLMVFVGEIWMGNFAILELEKIKIGGLSLILATKLGMAPMHFWFPSIVEHLSWESLLILLTWQKIAPLNLLTDVVHTNWSTGILICTSVWVGGVGGLIQTSLAKLMAYSSIAHMGWMVGAMKLNGVVWEIYFGIYVFLTFSILWMFFQENSYELTHFWMKNSMESIVKLSICMTLLSLGGLPPLLGFFSKWMIITGLVALNELFLIFFMVMMTLIALYYYFRVCFVVFMHLSDGPNPEKIFSIKNLSFKGWSGLILIGINLGGLGMGISF